jgi:hypothetical protein
LPQVSDKLDERKDTNDDTDAQRGYAEVGF